MITDERIREIEQRARAATEGPWRSDDGNVFSGPMSDRRHESIIRKMSGDPVKVLNSGNGEAYGFVASTGQLQPNFENDEAFIRESRTDIPDLLAALREAQAENGRLREALEDIIAHDNGTGDCAPAMQRIARTALSRDAGREG